MKFCKLFLLIEVLSKGETHNPSDKIFMFRNKHQEKPFNHPQTPIIPIGLPSLHILRTFPLTKVQL